jgi:hypothetical protein
LAAAEKVKAYTLKFLSFFLLFCEQQERQKLKAAIEMSRG